MSRRSTLILRAGILFVPVQAAATADAEELNRPISGAKSVLAIYTQSYGLSSNGLAPHWLVFAAWEDGYVVWSENAVQGGVPYRAGKIDPARLQTFLAKAGSDGLLQDKSLAQPQFGPDASTTIILAKSTDGELKMQSWHELYESNGKVVATPKGLVPLEGRPRFAALAKEPADYLFYRIAWDELRLGAASLIPTKSKSVDGKLKLRRGKAYWMQTPIAPK